MPLQATSGAASYDAFGGGAPAGPATYIEDVFSTYLYTGNGSTQTITNGIDLSTKGGLIWIKARDDTSNHALTDTVRGTNAQLNSNDSGTGTTATSVVTAFNTTGFNLGSAAVSNRNGFTFASWTFRKQPKMFDIQTWTGSGANRTIAHNLGSVPACIIVKRTDTTAAWAVYHRSLANTEYLILNSTAAKATGATWWNSTTPTSAVFSLGTDASVNASGGTFVAYLFAHDAGGFGLTGTDNVISCGSYTGNGLTAGPEVTLGYEPQWVMVKRSNSTGDWQIVDVMRPMSETQTNTLFPNLSSAEDVGSSGFPTIVPTATGFKLTNSGSGFNASGGNYIYIAIRRGPMKVPTLGTSVYNAVARTGTGAVAQVTGVGFTPDWVIAKLRAIGDGSAVYDRLRGNTKELCTSETADEYTITDGVTSFNMDGVSLGADATNGRINFSPRTYINWFFRRAPSFFDEVCYTGPGTVMTVNHNLQVAPELLIVKPRSASGDWIVYSSTLGATAGLYLDLPNGKYFNSDNWNNTSPTSSVFTVGANSDTNFGNRTYVAYLFATCAGVSKVGSYTGTGTTKQIDCGFTAGARFVLIKRTDSTGDWYVWDTARGIVSGNDPYLLLNSTAAEVTSTDYIDTYSAGFEISSTAPAAINANGGSFIFFAVS